MSMNQTLVEAMRDVAEVLARIDHKLNKVLENIELTEEEQKEMGVKPKRPYNRKPKS